MTVKFLNEWWGSTSPSPTEELPLLIIKWSDEANLIRKLSILYMQCFLAHFFYVEVQKKSISLFNEFFFFTVLANLKQM